MFDRSFFLLKLIFLSTFIFTLQLSYGQTASNNNGDTVLSKNDNVLKYSPITIRGYTNLLINNLGKDVSAPFKIRKKQLLPLGLFACATAALIISDPYIDAYAIKLDEKSKFIRTVSPLITNFGANNAYITVGALELAGLILKDKKLIITGSLASQAMITSSLFTRLGKILFSRTRPGAVYGTDAYEDGGIWNGVPTFIDTWEDTKKMPQSGLYSFPSGHTSKAFSIATVYAMMYNDHLAVPIIAYSVASLVGLSRVTQHAHWGSDVFVGAALGYLCGRQVVKNYQKLNKVVPSSRRMKLSFSLDYNENTYFAGLNFKF